MRYAAGDTTVVDYRSNNNHNNRDDAENSVKEDAEEERDEDDSEDKDKKSLSRCATICNISQTERLKLLMSFSPKHSIFRPFCTFTQYVHCYSEFQSNGHMLNSIISISTVGKYDKLYIFGNVLTSGFCLWYRFFNCITTKKF